MDLQSDADWGNELLPLLGRGAGIALGAVCLLFVASFFGACLARAGTTPHLASALMRCSPRFARQAVVAVAALVLPFTGASAAGAAETPVRTWLSGATATSTSLPVRSGPVVREGDVDRRAVTSAERSATTTTSAPTPPILPARPEPTDPAPAVATGAPAPTYVVRSGDSLWSIAARVLGDGATNRSIDRGWRVVYDANRAGVGPDPGLIQPGLVLTLPPLDTQP